MRLGKAQTRTFIAGINGAIVSVTTVEIDTTTGQLGVVPSSARYKQDIAPMGSRSDKMLELRPVTFAYKDDAQAITHYGLIAEEVATVYPDLVTRTASGEVQTVKYQELIPMLLNELQRQRQALQGQQQALQLQQQELAELRALVGQSRGKVVLGYFAYQGDPAGTKHYGLVAEEVAAVYPELVVRGETGGVQSVKYLELIPMLLNELQRQRHEFEQALQSQRSELAELRALVGQGRQKVVLGE
jgi:hypothetical protein